MLWALKQIITPLSYLKIRQGGRLFQSKAVYDWILPGTLTALTVVLSLCFYRQRGMFSENGLIGGFLKLLEIMVPFFIAALAAVATFAREGLDKPMKGHPAILKMRRSTGEEFDQVLTRRQFVCYLFGYLAFLALSLFIIILFLKLIGQEIGIALHQAAGEYFIYIRAIVIGVVYFMLWQLIITTFLGIYFMAERFQVMDDPEH